MGDSGNSGKRVLQFRGGGKTKKENKRTNCANMQRLGKGGRCSFSCIGAFGAQLTLRCMGCIRLSMGRAVSQTLGRNFPAFPHRTTVFSMPKSIV